MDFKRIILNTNVHILREKKYIKIKDNALCSVYNRYSMSLLNYILSLNIEYILKDTKLKGFTKR